MASCSKECRLIFGILWCQREIGALRLKDLTFFDELRDSNSRVSTLSRLLQGAFHDDHLFACFATPLELNLKRAISTVTLCSSAIS
jgi:hypothetical protein